MQFRMKFYISIISTILFIIASTIFFLDDHSMKWLWVCITVSSVVQNVVLFRKCKSAH
ncbi:hypothetical protein CN373_09290 [Bacillus cereus]|uniref:Uncharacterized protein n=1 Tax=Bacillus cereus TaxID=1396 RepID=A0AA44QBZ1_BACCE|nr:hypothetical protein CN373_09290 [Bacillus cereus]PFN05122.1 hypothetical protein COJ55_19315 [Bacillus cereus]PFO79768.1 hypothetical protein COJ77_19245 [Bacillus cereus]PFR25038.1 hypothetical protein COK19_16085 [Bacillus cereus]PFS03808.1 hypothetical protein COK38_07260 [Bacillus cereus]